MTSKKFDLATEIRVLQIVHLGMTLGVFVFAAVVMGLSYNESAEFYPLAPKEILIGLCGLVCVAMILASRYFFQQKIKNLQGPIDKKLADYRAACIVRCAFIEGGAFFSIVMALINGYSTLLIFAALAVVYMLVLFPTRKRVLDEIQPDFREMGELENL